MLDIILSMMMRFSSILRNLVLSTMFCPFLASFSASIVRFYGFWHTMKPNEILQRQMRETFLFHRLHMFKIGIFADE